MKQDDIDRALEAARQAGGTKASIVAFLRALPASTMFEEHEPGFVGVPAHLDMYHAAALADEIERRADR